MSGGLRPHYASNQHFNEWAQAISTDGHMDFDLTDAQQEIVQGVRAMCARFDDEYWRAKDAAHEFPHDFYQAVAEAGYLGVAIPEEFGGSGLGITEAALIMREVAYAGAMNAASAIHLSIFGLTP